MGVINRLIMNRAKIDNLSRVSYVCEQDCIVGLIICIHWEIIQSVYRIISNKAFDKRSFSVS